ncbi:YfgM family protein [Pelistega ratti]|uniref:YfgM family protein n=1 Tax=Pelistega ratti TaxID=2652177 RepID=UPI00135A10D0|nr:tetratricopeptide repeat protein [Pelistega ratti]
MAFDLEEQEKIDQVKAWWNRFGGLVTGILIVILLCIAGYYAWQWYQNSKANQALGYYDIVYASTSKTNPDANDKLRIQEALAVLQKDYVGTAYPARASLVASKYFIQQNDLAAAQQAVQWIIDESKETEILPVARLQLSAILMDQEKFDEAFAQVSKPAEHFVAAFLDRQGDILFAKGDKAGAVKAWKEALNDKDIDQNFVRLIQMKLNVLGGE